METRQGVERRRERRFQRTEPVKYRVYPEGGQPEPFRPGQMVDISSRGMRMFASQPVKTGAKIEVYVSTAEGAIPISGVLEVVRCNFRPHVKRNFNEYYNREVLAQYELGLRSFGSRLFDHIRDIA